MCVTMLGLGFTDDLGRRSDRALDTRPSSSGRSTLRRAEQPVAGHQDRGHHGQPATTSRRQPTRSGATRGPATASGAADRSSSTEPTPDRSRSRGAIILTVASITTLCNLCASEQMLRQPPGTTALTSPYGEHVQRQRDVGNVVKDVEAPHGQLADTVTASPSGDHLRTSAMARWDPPTPDRLDAGQDAG